MQKNEDGKAMEKLRNTIKECGYLVMKVVTLPLPQLEALVTVADSNTCVTGNLLEAKVRSAVSSEHSGNLLYFAILNAAEQRASYAVKRLICTGSKCGASVHRFSWLSSVVLVTLQTYVYI
jgi:hypothetical protein